jgi:hypothetical protein
MRLRRAAAALLAAAVLVSCRSAPAPPVEAGLAPGPILLVGLDGFEWNAVLPLLREGRLPHVAALLRRGSFGTLETIPGRVSPALWTTIATGKAIEKHGIVDFLKSRKPPVFFTSADRRTKAFWNMLGERGLRSATIGWFVTYPAEPVDGLLVAQTNTGQAMARMRMKKGSLLKGVSGQVHPPEREDAVFEVLEGVERDLDNVLAERMREPLADAPNRFRPMIETSRWSFRADETYLRVALRAAEERPDLLAVYFGSTDVLAHRLWPFCKPRSAPYRQLAGKRGKELAPRMQPGSWTNFLLGGVYWRAMEPFHQDNWPARMLRRTYEHADRMVGRLVESMPDDTRVILVSDHGFRPWHHMDGPDAFFLAAGPGIQDADAPEPERLGRDDLRRLGRIHDVAPTLLALAGLPFGQDMDGLPLEAVLQREARLEAPRPIQSWDDAGWLAARGAQAGPGPAADSGEEDAERLEQLRALGYIK